MAQSNSQPIPTLPRVAVVSGGPVGLMTALGLSRMGIPVKLFEDDGTFSSDTKAGTTLTRTLEISRRYGGVERILSNALRVGEIGEIGERNQVKLPKLVREI